MALIRTAIPSEALEPARSEDRFVPHSPASLEEAGLSRTLIEQLILKNLYFRRELTGRDLGKTLGLQFSVIEPALHSLKQSRYVEVKKSAGFGSVSSVFGVSDIGRARAKEYLEMNQFLGPAPVPLKVYNEAVLRQRVEAGWMTRDSLEKAYVDAVVTDDFFTMLGPAVNSFKSLLIYGKPGNGKTFLAEQLAHAESEPIFIPYAIEADGQVIKVFDSLYHERLDSDEESVLVEETLRFDKRWAECRRPFLTTGGELTLNMLDLIYIETAKIYDAPYQLKANNGIYLIDDFGRQKVSPAELLNRWIYPLDRGIDYLTFQTGNKVQAPFECFLIFSSNLDPHDLGDEAFLRRLEYKMYMRNPSEAEFREIFQRYCEKLALECSEEEFSRIIDKHYLSTDRAFRRCHPRDVLEVAVDLIKFERLPHRITPGLLDRAFDLKFVPTVYDEK